MNRNTLTVSVAIPRFTKEGRLGSAFFVLWQTREERAVEDAGHGDIPPR